MSPGNWAICVALIWLLYDNRAVESAVLLAVALFLYIVMHVHHTKKYQLLSAACLTAAFALLSTSDSSPWFLALHDGPHILFYCAFVLNVIATLEGCYQLAKEGSCCIRTIVYRIRFCIYMFIANCCFAVFLYYTTIVTRLIDTSKTNLTIHQTTQFVNETLCKPEKSDANSLYSSYTFTETCAYYVWVRNRINVLALLQVVIAFGLVVRVPYIMETRNPTVVYPLVELFRYALLFFAITFWFDKIEDWYIMPQYTAILLTLYCCTSAYIHHLVNNPARVQQTHYD